MTLQRKGMLMKKVRRFFLKNIHGYTYMKDDNDIPDADSSTETLYKSQNRRSSAPASLFVERRRMAVAEDELRHDINHLELQLVYQMLANYRLI